MTSAATAIGIAAALLAAVTGAAAHALLKSGRDKLAIRGLIALSCSMAAAPLAVFAPVPTTRLWPWLLLAALLHTVYQFVLVAAYEASDFSVVYPLARGVVPLSTAVVGLVALGDRLTAATALGIVAVTAGLLTLAYRSRVTRDGLCWALLAGLFTTAYTAVDGHAVRLSTSAATFIAWFFIMDGVMMVPLVTFLRRGRLVALLRDEGKQGIVAGLFALVGYGSALYALRLLPIGAASALRETSVVFGVLIACFTLDETVSRRQLAGVGLVGVGGIAIVLALNP